MIKVAVLGYGVVGSGVAEVIARNADAISRKAGDEIQVKYILDLRDFPGDPFEDRVVHDYDIILNDNEIGIVCEVMGGVGDAYRYTKQALEAGKNVCTSNKELVAKHGAELLKLAAAHHCSYMFEASVGGGIPIIRTINSALTAEKIQAVTGIVNGTTNYILTQMWEEGMDYQQALKQAQELGYAERNPEADVEGHDACRKLAILSSLITGKNVNTEKILTEGITKITREDFCFAREEDMVIKPLVTAQIQEDGSLLTMVAPFMVHQEHPLAGIKDVFNAVLVTGNMLGDAMFTGRGAGKLPTASAVAADVIECAKHPGRTIGCFWDEEEAGMARVQETERGFYLRLKRQGKEAAEKLFPEGRSAECNECGDVIGFFTPVMKEKDFAEKCGGLGDLVLNTLRIL